MKREIEEIFTWQGLSAEAQERTGAIRGRALELADAIDRLVPGGEEQVQAIRNLRMAMWWANAGISMGSRRGGPVQSPTSLPPLFPRP